MNSTFDLITFSKGAIEAARNYLSKAGTIRRGLYPLAEESTLEFDRAYESIASLMNFRSKEIFFLNSIREIEEEVLLGPFDTSPSGFVDLSSIIHRGLSFEKAVLRGEVIGVPGIIVVAIKEEILQKMRPLEFGGGMVSSVSLQAASYAELPYRFSAGTPDVASILALGAAAREYKVDESIDRVTEEFEGHLISKKIPYDLFALSNCFRIDGRDYYVPRSEPSKIFSLEAVL